jgi:hypothetical protein
MGNDEEPPSGGDGGKEESKPAGFKEWATRLGVTGNVAVQGVNILLDAKEPWGGISMVRKVGRGCTYASGGIAIVNSPVVVHRERQLTKEDTFRTALNGVREQAALLGVQNEILSAEIDELQSDVDRMNEVELALRSLTETQGTQLEELTDLIEENKEINARMRSVLEKKILEDVISLVLDIDADGSFKIEHKEIDRLIVGMTLIEGITKFNTSMFREEIANCEGKVELVIALIKSMMSSKGDCCCIEIEDAECFLKRQCSRNSSSQR